MAKKTASKKSKAAKKPAPPAKRRLGRGLSSLISSSVQVAAEDPQVHRPIPQDPETIQEAAATEEIQPTGAPSVIEISQIAPNPYQPRKEFNAEELADLARSIREQGILQPLLVVEASDAQKKQLNKDYILIAGERRLRAARVAELDTVPCIIREADTQQMLEWAIIENIQRADLNPIDRARAYRDYLDRFNLTQAQAAEKLGEPRATVANYLRMLDLSDDVQKLLLDGKLSFGHAKVLAGLAGQPEKQLALAGRVAAGGLSVRQLETIVAAEQNRTDQADDPSKPAKPSKPAYIRDLEEQLTHAVGTHVSIQTGKKKHSGKIVVEFYSLDDFDRIATSLGLRIEP